MRPISLFLGLAVLAVAERAPGSRVRLRVPELAGTDRSEIVTSGVPLGKGVLRDGTQCRLLAANGAEVPFVGTVLARWPGGTVKWLLLDFRLSVPAGQTADLTLECGVTPTASITDPRVTVDEDARSIQVTTGPLRFRISRDRYTFLDAVWPDVRGGSGFSEADSIIVPGEGDSRLEIETTPPGPPQAENWLVDAGGGPRRRFAAAVADARVEFHNPLRAVVLVRGEYRAADGETIGPLWTRYTAWSGSSTIGVEHFFAFDADVEAAFLRSLSCGIRFRSAAPLEARFGLEQGESVQPAAAHHETALVEVMPDRFYHLVPLSGDRRVGYQVLAKARDGTDTLLKEGVEATGWVSVGSDVATATVALRDFPRLHPKEIRVEPTRRALRYFLWPERGGKVLDLRRRYEGQRIEGQYDTGEYGPAGRGFGETHQLLIDFSPGKTDPARSLALARRANEPLRAFCTPEHYASSDVWNRFHPVDAKRFPKAEALIRLGLEWWRRAPRHFHWDGMVDWGDTLFHGYEAAPHKQVRDVPKTSWVVRGYDGWLNNDCNIAHDVMIFFLRSGDDRLFQYWERMVRHIMDVDTIHAAEDPTQIGGGRRHDQQHWGATYTGYGTAAVEAGELYCLTGSLWAREMLVKYADWYMVGGGAEWETRLPCLVLAWEITGDDRYMAFIRRPAMRSDVYGLALGRRGAIDRPHWRTSGVELGVDFLYRATGDKQWTDHLTKAARQFIETNPGNNYGRSLLAKAYMATSDTEILDWMRRLQVVGNPYARAGWASFFRGHDVPENLSAVPWEELTRLARAASLLSLNGLIYTFRHEPYVMAALTEAGLDERQMESVDFALDRRGMGQYHLRGPDVPGLTDSHFEPVSLASVANCDPLADPFGRYDGWTRRPLEPGEIGFDFGEWGECEPGYLPVRPATHYPYSAPLPRPTEHDGTNLIGLPFGTTVHANSVPFALPDPATVPEGRTMLALGKGARIRIPVRRTVRKLYVLGHVCRAKSSWKEVGARYRLRYADGMVQTVELTNLEDYEHIFHWGFAKRALFARNWKVQGGWDGGTPILNTYPLACEEKLLEELVVEDTGGGIGLLILAVTAEVPGAAEDTPQLKVSFAAEGAAANAWAEGARHGWLNVSGNLVQAGDGVQGDGAATFRTALADGLYDLELELSGVGWSGPCNIRTDGQLIVRGFVPTSGCIPGVTSRPDRIRFPVRVDGGRLDLTIQADRTVGTWRHRVRLRGPAWRLTHMQVFSRSTTEPAGARQELTHGWLERDLTVAAVPAEVSRLSDARIQTCMRSTSPRGTFRADVPAGEYDAELIFAVRGTGTREGPIRMDVSLQGKRVLAAFDGGSYSSPVSRAFPIRIAADGHLELTLESGGNDSEWGVSALVLRPRGGAGE